MNFEILLSTMNRTELDIDFYQKRNIKDKTLIVNQNKDIECIVSHNDNRIIFSKTKGLSKSRNIAIENSNADICLISDDDIIFGDDLEEKILYYYDKFPEADIITFLITMGDEDTNLKQFKKVFRHNKRSILSVGSNQITFRLNSIRKNKILFDESFGLGSKMFNSGEETMFLLKCLRSGLKIYNIPVIISNHSTLESSNSIWTKSLIETKGAFFKCYSKNFWWMYMIYLYVVKKNILDEHINFVEYFHVWKNGVKRYEDTRKSFG